MGPVDPATRFAVRGRVDYQATELVGFGASGIQILLALVTLVLGVALVRPVNATAGYAVAAAGGIRLLLTCCNDFALAVAQRQVMEVAEPLSYVRSCMYPLDQMAFWGLLLFAALTIAKQVQR